VVDEAGGEGVNEARGDGATEPGGVRSAEKVEGASSSEEEAWQEIDEWREPWCGRAARVRRSAATVVRQ